MPRLRYVATARADLEAIVRYIARAADLGTARRFAERLRIRCTRLAALGGTLGQARPDLGPGLRSVSEQSYVIIFRYADDWLEIVRVLHGSRDLGRAVRNR